MIDGLADELLLRATAATVLVAALGLVVGRRAIRFLALRFREPIKSNSARLDELHRHKAATPTMGGLFVIAGIALGCAVFADWRNPHVPIALAVTVGMGTVGATDDLVKLRGPRRGLGGKSKLCAQVAVAAIPSAAFLSGFCAPADEPWLLLPGVAALAPSWFITPWTMLVIVATANAVNLTDGLDGLAAGCLACTLTALAAIVYLCIGDAARELLVFTGAALGALLAFLYFNRHPARVFLGNVGALALGGAIGYVALATGTEMWLPIAGGVFVVEAVSVILQIGSFRLLGRRVLRCAPLHHHFEFLGWTERATVRRFWCAAVGCAGLSLVLAVSGREFLRSLASGLTTESQKHGDVENSFAAALAKSSYLEE